MTNSFIACTIAEPNPFAQWHQNVEISQTEYKVSQSFEVNNLLIHHVVCKACGTKFTAHVQAI